MGVSRRFFIKNGAKLIGAIFAYNKLGRALIPDSRTHGELVLQGLEVPSQSVAMPPKSIDDTINDASIADGWYIQYSFNQVQSYADNNVDYLKKLGFENARVHKGRTLIGRFSSLEAAAEETDKIKGVDEVGIVQSRQGVVTWNNTLSLNESVPESTYYIPKSMRTNSAEPNGPLGMPSKINKVFLEKLEQHNEKVRKHNSKIRNPDDKEYEINEYLSRAILHSENSSYNPTAAGFLWEPIKLKNGEYKFVHKVVDGKKIPVAFGLGMLTPGAMRDIGMDSKKVYVADDNIAGHLNYLGLLLKENKGNETLAVAAYNGGRTKVRELGRVPNFPETKKYVRRVMGTYRDLKSSWQLALNR